MNNGCYMLEMLLFVGLKWLLSLIQLLKIHQDVCNRFFQETF
ncbi:hypothetical protein COMA2_40050 [Candidatus Nitrospira nitrificans]|uniref:Uncharacterized protein n=1 Tax=Candidatus Nitrospira nitrificans TaxID=1742973 RepID=A0A0S4LPG2_9BACT|nr:hypothetical protein COMA2_40050 [Candidatus Nitrospira nitrificans]